MHRALTVAVVLAVVAGTVPAAASLADGTPSNTEPGASFAGVVGVQGAEVNNEVANRSLEKQFNAAKSNRSKARVVASESQQLETRLAELEAEKERLNAAYENGSISKGKYTAQLAVVAADLRALERRANRTAGVAETLPPDTLRETGANVSHVREIAQQANRTGGGAVAEAAREIAGNGVGDGLGGRPSSAGPPNGSETGPPENVGAPNGSTGSPADAGNNGNAGPPTSGPAANASNRSSTGAPAGAGSGQSNESGRAGEPPAQSGNASSPENAANASASNATNRSANGNRTANVSERPGNGSNRSAAGTGNAANASNGSANASNGNVDVPWQGTESRPAITRDWNSKNETATDSSVGRAAFTAF